MVSLDQEGSCALDWVRKDWWEPMPPYTANGELRCMRVEGRFSPPFKPNLSN